MLEYLTYALVVLSLGMYIVLDGYDLGVGILSLFVRGSGRREYSELIATAWDANESWIVLAGVTLWAGLPGVYATIMPGLYLPLICMLLAIILRGMGLEFQSASPVYQRRWALLFGGASLIVAVCQGLVVGGVLSGLHSVSGTFQGAAFDWFTPYSVLCAAGLVVLYLLAGAAWLQDKTDGEAHALAGRLGRPLLIASVVASLVLGFGLEVADPQAFRFDQTARGVLFGLAVAAAAGFGAFAWYGFGRRPDWRPFVGVVGAEISGLLALVAATAPVIVPTDLTVTAAASPPGSQLFLVIGVGLCMPVVFAYNIYAWWVFRGKYRETAAPAIPALRTRDAANDIVVGPDSGHVVVVIRRILLTVVAVFAVAVAQDVFSSKGVWLDRAGVALFVMAALTAWVLGDRRDRRRGEFDLDVRAEAGRDS
jgi:cytochrome d ubiquinol oxidase subunit II